jgi:hypothetical protein
VERWVAAEDEAREVDAVLAAAGLAALKTAVGQSGDRSVALDLLAADALVTLALLHRAEHDPAGLAAFARQVRMHGASPA